MSYKLSQPPFLEHILRRENDVCDGADQRYYTVLQAGVFYLGLSLEALGLYTLFSSFSGAKASEQDIVKLTGCDQEVLSRACKELELAGLLKR